MSEIKKFKKGSYMTNPETKRPIVVGGRVFMKLLKKGVLSEEYKNIEDDVILDDFKDTTEAIEKKDEYVRKLPKNMQAVKGRGRYKGKIVKRYKKTKKPNITKRIQQRVENTEPSSERMQARELLEILKGLDHNADIEDQLEQIIIQNRRGDIKYESDDENIYDDDDDDDDIYGDSDSDSDSGY